MPGVSAEDGLAGAAGAGAGAVLRPQPPSVLHPHLGRLPPPGDDDGDDDDVNDDDNPTSRPASPPTASRPPGCGR